MKHVSKTDLSPDNGCVVDLKWSIGPLRYYAGCIKVDQPAVVTSAPRMPEVVIYDHTGFGGAFARTNLSFHFIGDYWNDRISSLIVVSGVWRFYRDEYYKGPHWELGPGFYECFWDEKMEEDVISSFCAVALT